MPIFRKGPGPHALAVAMAGVRMGERLLAIGGGTPGMFAALAAKVGLTGRACAVGGADTVAQGLRQAAAREGVLVEVSTAALPTRPFDGDAFDLVLVDATAGMPGLPAGEWAACLREARRVLRVGGRSILVERTGRTGLAALFGAGAAPPLSAGTAEAAFREAGFNPVRTLAEREGLLFVEGLKRTA